jgi:ERCC4-type nuclease
MLLDDREHGLRALLPSAPIAHLPVGDIWIGAESLDTLKPNGLVIERKAVADLEASILDHRYREQRSRILAFCTEKQAHPVYIIEGNLDRLGARLTKSVLLKHLTRLALRYHIQFFQTESVDETAQLCTTLEEQMVADPTTFEQPATMTYVETRGNTREGNTDDPSVFACNVLMCCRGVSAAAAKAVLEACGGTLENVWAADAGRLAAVQVGKQKFGPARAQRLYSLLHHPRRQVIC